MKEKYVAEKQPGTWFRTNSIEGGRDSIGGGAGEGEKRLST